jgi:hypothetical protein
VKDQYHRIVAPALQELFWFGERSEHGRTEQLPVRRRRFPAPRSWSQYSSYFSSEVQQRVTPKKDLL